MTSRQSPKLKPSPWDAIVVAAVIALGVFVTVVFYGGKSADHDLKCVVSAGSKTVDTIALRDAAKAPIARTYQGNGYTLHMTVTADGVCVSESDCPSQDCVHTGTITRSGQSIVCLPAQIVIHLEGTANSGPDVIVG
ncbi:MAG: NusG domain II-containing protein [Clostridiales bacterium]|nr:NusG domain II-containing protein [Candidatus Cacconaster stercorequi]